MRRMENVCGWDGMCTSRQCLKPNRRHTTPDITTQPHTSILFPTLPIHPLPAASRISKYFEVGLLFPPRSSTLGFPSRSFSSRPKVSYPRVRSSMNSTSPCGSVRESKCIHTRVPAGMCEMLPSAPMITCSLDSHGFLEKRR